MRISDHTLNRLNILKAILRHGPVARTDLPGLTGLSAGLITQQTSALVSSGLVSETRDSNSRKGRPRQFLHINADAAVVVGASIDGRGNLQASFGNLTGNRLVNVVVSFPSAHSLDEWADHLGAALLQAIDDSGIQFERIARIGIALPAVIDSERGRIHYSATFPVHTTSFALPISELLGIPVTIENDMMCMARAEHWFGHARQHQDFTMIRVGPSVYLAEYAGGLPKFGGNGINPEFGHVKTGIGMPERKCYCGATGCLATYCSMFGLLQDAGQLANLPFPPMEHLETRFGALIDKALGGDVRAQQAIALAALHLGVAVANHLNMANPPTLFVSIDNKDFMDLLREPFMAALEANTMPGILPLTSVEFVQTNDDWRWTGTAALALEQLYLANDRNGRGLAGRDRKTPDCSPESGTGAMLSVA